MGKRSLTAAFVKNAKDAGRYYDNQNTGLHIYVRKGGSKSWIQRVRLNGKNIDISLGSASKVTLVDARFAALENSKLISMGIDPRYQKEKPSNIPTFEQMAHEALSIKEQELKNPKHIAQWHSTLATFAFPVLGNMPVDTITVNDVHRTLEKAWGRTNETAQRTRGRIEFVFNHAITKGYASHPNPAVWKGNLEHLLPRPSKVQKPQKMPALMLSDAQRWWQELKQRDGIGAYALKMLVLSAARSGEVRGMHWDEIELYDAPSADTPDAVGLWTIPAERMKAEREHTVPITQAMRDILEALPHKEELVFPSSRGGMLSDMTLSALMKRIHSSDGTGYFDKKSKRPAVPHGFRSTFRDWAAETRQDYDLSELQLAHRIGGDVQHAYNRTDLVQLRASMMNQWHDFLEGKRSLRS